MYSSVPHFFGPPVVEVEPQLNPSRLAIHLVPIDIKLYFFENLVVIAEFKPEMSVI